MRSMRGANRLDHRLFRSGPEAFEDLGHGALEIGDRGLATVQRREHVDEHDLPVEPREMIAEEGPHHVRLIRFIAPFHHREERAAQESPPLPLRRAVRR